MCCVSFLVLQLHGRTGRIINNSSSSHTSDELWWIGERKERELHNRSALFRCELLHIFTGEKDDKWSGRVMCRTTMPLRWMNEGLLPPCLLLCYVYNYNNDTRRWNQKGKKEEKLGISYLKIYSRIDLHLRWFCYSRNYCVYLQPYRCSCWRSHISKKCKRVKDFFFLPCTQFLLTCWYYTRFPNCAKSAKSFCLIMTFRSVGCYKMSSFPCRLFFTFSLFEFFFASEFPLYMCKRAAIKWRSFPASKCLNRVLVSMEEMTLFFSLLKNQVDSQRHDICHCQNCG